MIPEHIIFFNRFLLVHSRFGALIQEESCRCLYAIESSPACNTNKTRTSPFSASKCNTYKGIILSSSLIKKTV